MPNPLNFFFVYRARRLRKGLGGGMRQCGVLAAAGMVAMDTIIPILKYDHRRARKIAESILAFNSSYVKVDLNRVQTNLIIVDMIDDKKYPARKFLNRLSKSCKEEIQEGICDKNGLGIAIRVGSRDSTFVRLAVYHEITDDDIDLTIKKILFCLKELEDNQQNGSS